MSETVTNGRGTPPRAGGEAPNLSALADAMRLDGGPAPAGSPPNCQRLLDALDGPGDDLAGERELTLHRLEQEWARQRDADLLDHHLREQTRRRREQVARSLAARGDWRGAFEEILLANRSRFTGPLPPIDDARAWRRRAEATVAAMEEGLKRIDSVLAYAQRFHDEALRSGVAVLLDTLDPLKGNDAVAKLRELVNTK